IAILNVIRKINRPGRGYIGAFRRRDCGKIIAIGIICVIWIAIVRWQSRKRHILCLAVQINDAAFQMQMIARNSDHALDQEQFWLARFIKNDDISMAYVSIMNKRRPMRWWRKTDSVYQNMVAD